MFEFTFKGTQSNFNRFQQAISKNVPYSNMMPIESSDQETRCSMALDHRETFKVGLILGEFLARETPSFCPADIYEFLQNLAYPRRGSDAETWEIENVAIIAMDLLLKHESVVKKQYEWLKNGERGMSSDAIFSVMSGIPVSYKGRQDAPSDYSDFRRCYELLESIPEWKPRIKQMAKISQEWERLAEIWTELSDLHETGEYAAFDNLFYTIKA